MYEHPGQLVGKSRATTLVVDKTQWPGAAARRSTVFTILEP